MLLQIITPEKIEWQGEIDSLTLPTSDGEITILTGHANLVSAVEAGEMTVNFLNKENHFFISEGSVLVKNNEIIVLSDIATEATDLTMARVEEARKAAEVAKEEKVDEIEFATIEANLRRELAKEKIMEKYKKKMKNVE